MPSIPGIPFDVNPHVAQALVELSILMDDYHYSQHAREQILAYTAAHGTPSGCACLDREDEADASMVFEESLPIVPWDSPAWDRETDTITLDVPMLEAGVHPFPLLDPSDWPAEATLIAHEAPDGRHVVAKMLANGVLPPISGGCDECYDGPDAEVDDPYEPTAEDLADLADWSERLDRERDIAEQREFWRRTPIEAFNEQRMD
jgi:hypothetical protein